MVLVRWSGAFTTYQQTTGRIEKYNAYTVHAPLSMQTMNGNEAFSNCYSVEGRGRGRSKRQMCLSNIEGERKGTTNYDWDVLPRAMVAISMSVAFLGGWGWWVVVTFLGDPFMWFAFVLQKEGGRGATINGMLWYWEMWIAIRQLWYGGVGQMIWCLHHISADHWPHREVQCIHCPCTTIYADHEWKWSI